MGFLSLVCLLVFLIVQVGSDSVRVAKSLPGFTGSLPFKLETGYIVVDESNDVQLFYYFVESEGNPREDPVMLWLTGGPGCSAFSGLVYEIGQLRFNNVEYNGSLPTFSLNPYSWTQASSIIFLDAPVGTGFSYSRSLQGWNTSDTKSAEQIYTFLRKLLVSHPKFNSNPLYIAGDSYSGITVPVIAQEISNVAGVNAGIELQHKPLTNLKGYILGNPGTDRNFDANSRIPFAHRVALISDELYEATKASCRGDYVNVDTRSVQCDMDLETVFNLTAGVNQGHILEPYCRDVTQEEEPTRTSRRSLTENFIHSPAQLPFPDLRCRTYGYLLSTYWANDDRVRDAFHIKNGTVETWKRCNLSIPYTKDVQSSLADFHRILSKKGYRSLVYSGDHDITIPHLGTQEWIKSLNFSVVDEWRPWFADNQVAGEEDTQPPRECLAMFKRWLSHNPLDGIGAGSCSKLLSREDVKKCIVEVMHGPKMEEMKKNALKWKRAAEEAMAEGGSSDQNIQDFVR